MPTALPVSAPVDTFMQSANQAAMQVAIGLSPISSPQVVSFSDKGGNAIY